jgi:plastocyanin
MRRFSALPLLWLLAVMGCGSDSGPGGPEFDYALHAPAATLEIGQDSSGGLALVAVRGASDTIVFPKLATVTLGAAGFTPASVNIDATGQVVFSNTSGTAHAINFHSNSISDIPSFAAGDITRTFNTVGTFTYNCTTHPLDSGAVVVRAGARILYESSDFNVATVDTLGNVFGLRGGSATITASLSNASVEVPVTVRGHPADSLELTVLTGPGGGLKGVVADTGTFFALPADPGSSRLKAIVRVGTDTVFCNYCVTKTPARVQRLVRFRSLDPALALVTNATNPRLQSSTDTSGRVTPLAETTDGARIVIEVPGDSGIAPRWADTVTLKFSMRPLDTLRIRPDSNFFPTANGTGLQKQIYPNADTLQANVVQSSNTNFIAGLDFLSRVQDPPAPPGTGANPNPRFIVSRLSGGPTVRRPSLPNVTWESANPSYLAVNAAGAVIGFCAFIGAPCPTAGSSVLNCDSVGGSMPAAFGGQGTYAVPSCVGKAPIPMPGALCTSNSAADLTSICSVWIRASATDEVSGKLLRRLYRVNMRR